MQCKKYPELPCRCNNDHDFHDFGLCFREYKIRHKGKTAEKFVEGFKFCDVGTEFTAGGDRYKIIEIFDEPFSGLIKLEVNGYVITVPAALVEGLLQEREQAALDQSLSSIRSGGSG